MITNEPYSPAQPQQQSAAQPPQQKGFGNQYVGIQQYLNANRNAISGAQAGAGASQKAAEEYKVKSAAERAEEARQEAIGSNKDTQGLISRVSQGGALSDAETAQVKEYQKVVSNPLTPLDQRASSASAMAALQGQRNQYANMNKSWLGQSVMGSSGVNQQYQQDMSGAAQGIQDVQALNTAAMGNDASMSDVYGQGMGFIESQLRGAGSAANDERTRAMAANDFANDWARKEYQSIQDERNKYSFNKYGQPTIDGVVVSQRGYDSMLMNHKNRLENLQNNARKEYENRISSNSRGALSRLRDLLGVDGDVDMSSPAFNYLFNPDDPYGKGGSNDGNFDKGSDKIVNVSRKVISGQDSDQVIK